MEEDQKVSKRSLIVKIILIVLFEGSLARVMMTDDYGATWSVVETTMEAGGDTVGIFSLAVQGDNLVAVGGDFKLPGQSNRKSVSISRDGGQTWAEPDTPTYGYRYITLVQTSPEYSI